jgi:hypothetical protein
MTSLRPLTGMCRALLRKSATHSEKYIYLRSVEPGILLLDQPLAKDFDILIGQHEVTVPTDLPSGEYQAVGSCYSNWPLKLKALALRSSLWTFRKLGTRFQHRRLRTRSQWIDPQTLAAHEDALSCGSWFMIIRTVCFTNPPSHKLSNQL